MARIVGRYGPVKVDGASVDTVYEWTLDHEIKLEEVRNFTTPYRLRVNVNSGWTATVKCELPDVGRRVGAIAVGSWTGVEATEWTFGAECMIDEVTAQADEWKVYQVVEADWTYEATKWQATDSHEVFSSLLQAQSGAWANVAFSCPYGSGDGMINKAAISNPYGPSDEKLTIVCSGGTLSTTDTLISIVNTATAAILSGGYATPSTLQLPVGSGDSFIKKVSYKAPVGKVTLDVEFQGTGEFTFS